MNIIINGEQLSLADGLTIEAMLRARGNDPAVVVVERNGDIVPAADFAVTPLADGDAVEIVHFVGGG
ncbi:MAG: sulfur carrier protein ThiS [Desulfovibrio sp.]|uniref:sulfur carrier protein ThiS n=1 Tax=Desulfovibrio sp. TaxID=885 RepID=UPI0025BB16C1|nr:sulfur carrier protein ThiS [Desulfovibrio sp.]MCI7568446.1 sulfur carrier protein ThiS [Desulfovibrio sp.]